MTTEITIEVDDIHKLMFKEMVEDSDNQPDLEDWAQNTIETILYQSYKGQ